jgi:hypothetical protein
VNNEPLTTHKDPMWGIWLPYVIHLDNEEMIALTKGEGKGRLGSK